MMRRGAIALYLNPNGMCLAKGRLAGLAGTLRFAAISDGAKALETALIDGKGNLAEANGMRDILLKRIDLCLENMPAG